MGSIIQSVVGLIAILAIGSTFDSFYREVKTETVLKVHGGLSPLEPFTQKLTGMRMLETHRKIDRQGQRGMADK